MNGARDLIRLAERDGWTVSITNGGHLRLDHRDATMPVFAASTPSCPRALANALATMRRALPPEPKPEPKVPRPKPRRRVDSAIEVYRPPADPQPPHGVGGSTPRRPPRPLPGGPSGYVTTRWPA
jgi:predicted RNA binding protein YcfA (HicA-like mRNA interferase family)